VPIRSLAGFKRIFLKKGEKRTVSFTLKPEQFSLIADNGERIIEPGIFEISIGGGIPGRCAPTTSTLTKKVQLSGTTFVIDDFQF
jgi:beta-glucosidase